MKKMIKNISYKCKYYKNINYAEKNPYQYEENNYSNTFLTNYPKKNTVHNKIIPKKIYAFWTGHNKMSNNRLHHYQELKKKAEIDVILITPNNLSDYIVDDSPLHEAFEYLSLVHKSDYLRCYFMHHHGGGYSDIKASKHSWVPFFEKIDKNQESYIIGYPETKLIDLAPVGGRIGEDMSKYFSQIVGNCAYICRSKTPFTQEWYQELLNRMDFYAEKLKKNPGNIMGDNHGYPIPWTNILGDIFHPLCLKYMDKIIKEPKMKPSIKDYR